MNEIILNAIATSNCAQARSAFLIIIIIMMMMMIMIMMIIIVIIIWMRQVG